jgi:hypothetical protein
MITLALMHGGMGYGGGNPVLALLFVFVIIIALAGVSGRKAQ